MKTTKMQGLLCRSHASTAVCIPGDLKSVIVPRRPDRTLSCSPAAAAASETARLLDRKYSARFGPSDRYEAVTIPMVMKKERNRPKRFYMDQQRQPVDVPTLPPAPSDLAFQVVVMRVSIHCQGCAGKVKKHISKMEGVTSYSIDLESKRVTVMGHVSPAGVLESISKVKKAEFWNC